MNTSEWDRLHSELSLKWMYLYTGAAHQICEWLLGSLLLVPFPNSISMGNVHRFPFPWWNVCQPVNHYQLSPQCIGGDPSNIWFFHHKLKKTIIFKEYIHHEYLTSLNKSNHPFPKLKCSWKNWGGSSGWNSQNVIFHHF